MEHVSKRIKITDENLGRTFAKAKPFIAPASSAVPPPSSLSNASLLPRRVLGDVSNQIVKKVHTGKPAESNAFKPRSRVPMGVAPKPKDSPMDTEETEEAPVPLAQDPSEALLKPTEADLRRLKEEEEQAYAAKLERMGIPDLDLIEANDPLSVSEYAVDIFKYLLELERKYQPSAEYMSNQKDISWKMRSVLINWLVEVHWKYKMLQETLFLCINIMDRYLAEKPVPRSQLQLVGVTSLFIASKYEEIYSPSTEDFLYVCSDSYTHDQLLKMERDILYALQFNLGSPCSLSFLRRISKAEDYDIPSRTVAKYLIEAIILDESFLKYHPSLQAAASCWLARKMLKKGEWNKTLEFYSGYSEKDLEPCVNDLLQFLQRNTKHRSIFKKYSSSKFLRASLFVEQKISSWTSNDDAPDAPDAPSS